MRGKLLNSTSFCSYVLLLIDINLLEGHIPLQTGPHASTESSNILYFENSVVLVKRLHF